MYPKKETVWKEILSNTNLEQGPGAQTKGKSSYLFAPQLFNCIWQEYHVACKLVRVK